MTIARGTEMHTSVEEGNGRRTLLQSSEEPQETLRSPWIVRSSPVVLRAPDTANFTNIV